MAFENLYLVKCAIDQRTKASLEEAKSVRMLREAGIDHRPRIIRQARRVLSHLGHSLVSLGQRLEHYGASSEHRQPVSHSQSAQ